MREYLASAQFMATVIVVVITLILLGTFDYFIRESGKKPSRNKNRSLVLKKTWSVIKIIIVVTVVLSLLSINGVKLGKYVAGLGIASAIAGFALQDPIKDVIAGLAVILEGYFRIGDIVVYNGEVGKIVAFNIKTTWIFIIEDERTVIVNNRNLTDIALASDWIDVDIPIGYNQDLQLSRSLCREAAKRIERLRYVYSCDFLNTQEFAESWVVYRLRVHCLPEKRLAVRRNSNAVVQDVFYERGVEFPLSIKVIYSEDAGEVKAVPPGALGDDKTALKVRGKKRVDYELGKGAARSKTCVIDSTKEAAVKVMSEAERYALAENLDEKMKLRMRLLSEEAISLINILTDVERGEFYIEREGADYEICLDAEAIVSTGAHDKLVSVSSTGSNEAYGGLSGLVKRAVDAMIRKSRHNGGEAYADDETVMDKSIVRTDEDLKWSYNIFREHQKSMPGAPADGSVGSEDGDSLEMSVLTKFSDDIKIAVRANHVNIRILVKSPEE